MIAGVIAGGLAVNSPTGNAGVVGGLPTNSPTGLADNEGCEGAGVTGDLSIIPSAVNEVLKGVGTVLLKALSVIGGIMFDTAPNAEPVRELDGGCDNGAALLKSIAPPALG